MSSSGSNSGRAHGVLGPQSEAFTLALLFDRVDAPFIAVPDPQSNAGVNDRLDQAFPSLFREGTSVIGLYTKIRRGVCLLA
jgi:hypothetical protein